MGTLTTTQPIVAELMLGLNKKSQDDGRVSKPYIDSNGNMWFAESYKEKKDRGADEFHHQLFVVKDGQAEASGSRLFSSGFFIDDIAVQGNDVLVITDHGNAFYRFSQGRSNGDFSKYHRIQDAGFLQGDVYIASEGALLRIGQKADGKKADDIIDVLVYSSDIRPQKAEGGEKSFLSVDGGLVHLLSGHYYGDYGTWYGLHSFNPHPSPLDAAFKTRDQQLGIYGVDGFDVAKGVVFFAISPYDFNQMKWWGRNFVGGHYGDGAVSLPMVCAYNPEDKSVREITFPQVGIGNELDPSLKQRELVDELVEHHGVGKTYSVTDNSPHPTGLSIRQVDNKIVMALQMSNGFLGMFELKDV